MRPGDAVVADQDGAVVVPFKEVEKVIKIAEEREEVEMIIKEELRQNPGPPGKYYPFKPPIKQGSPLYQLLERKKPEVLPRMSFSTSSKHQALEGGRSIGRRSFSSSSSMSGTDDVIPETMTGALIREVRNSQRCLHKYACLRKASSITLVLYFMLPRDQISLQQTPLSNDRSVPITSISPSSRLRWATRTRGPLSPCQCPLCRTASAS